MNSFKTVLKRTIKVCASSLLIVGANSVIASELLDRLETASEAVSKNQAKFYVSKIPELKGKMPAWEWDEQIRSASKCVLKGIELSKGSAIAEAYVAGLEHEAYIDITSAEQLNNPNVIPAELRSGDQTLSNLTQSCGTLEISTIRLKESGFWDAMMNPAIRNKLSAD